MKATLNNGDEWTGETELDGGLLYLCRDKDGNLYSTREVPAFRIVMDGATQTIVNGKRTICPMFTCPLR